MSKIDKEYLGTLVSQELNLADSWMDGDLAREQEKALDYYYGEPYGNEEEGFSSVVTRDVLETVEGIMPELMKIFTSGDNVVEFDPAGPQDEPRVKIQGRYINHVFMNRFSGYKLLYDWFKDALLMKNGIIKAGWDDSIEVRFKEYEDLSSEEFQILKDGELEDDELLGFEYEIDSYVKEKQADNTVLYDVRCKLTSQRGRPDIVVIPNEEFRIKQRSTCIKDADFVAHEMTKTIGELIEMGFDEDDVRSATVEGDDYGIVKDARFQDPDETELGSNSRSNSYDREVQFLEAYVKTYDEDDKQVKIYKVLQVGKECLDYEEVDKSPFLSLTPIMMPHKFTGVSVADLVKDIQEIRSTIFRQMLDNLALQNAGRYTAVEGQVNLQDLIDNRIGGIVRQKMPGAVQRLDTPDLSTFTVPVLQQLDLQKEDRTGVSRMTHGLDSSALSSHQTASAVNQVMTAAQGKILLIARNFAETGVKDLFLELYNLIREHQVQPDIIPINGEYAVVNPVEWVDRYDVHVTVGIGNGNKDQQLYHLNNIMQMMQTIGGSDYGYMITAENMFNLASEMITNSGYVNPNQFITNPKLVEPPEPQPDPAMIAAQATMVSAQADAKKKGSDVQVDQAEFQLDSAKFDWQKKIDAVEATIEVDQERPVGLQSGK